MRKLFSPKDLKEEDREDFERELRELMYKTFKNGEYLDAEIVVDEKLNILSGRIIPYKEI